MLKIKILYPLIIIFFLSGLVFLLHQKVDRDYKQALDNFVASADQDAKVMALDVDTKLKSIYQNIRTISVTPQIRKIDRHAKNFDLDGRFFIQQIYNNLKFAVDVSEVYVVSKEFDGEKMDPETGEMQLPNTMFDDLITGLSADKMKVVNEHLYEDNKHTELEKAEEVEIFEFRNVKNQIAELGAQFKSLGDIKTLDNIPCMISNPLITCDNTYYEKSRNDADRTGIMMSVPFYNPKDQFEGVISAIILLENMRKWLPNANYALSNPAYNLAVYQPEINGNAQHIEWIQAGKTPENLLFARDIKLSIPDVKGAWTLRAGLPNELFLNSSEVSAIRQFTYAGYVVIFFIGLLIFVMRRMMVEMENRKLLLVKNKALQDELLLSARKSGMADVATSVLHNVGNVLNSINTSVTMVHKKVTESNVSNISKVAAMITTNQEKLDEFLTTDPQGKLIPDYIGKLADKWGQDKTYLLGEIQSLQHNVTHIKEIISRQNNAFGAAEAMNEDVQIIGLIDDALKINASSFLNAPVKIERHFMIKPVAHLDRVKLMQVVVNLIKNAYEALLPSSASDKTIWIKIEAKDTHCFLIQIKDNGVGISKENLSRITMQGFTTKNHGHGFGVHASALAIQQMGGNFVIESDGENCGACFTLILPYKHVEKK